MRSSAVTRYHRIDRSVNNGTAGRSLGRSTRPTTTGCPACAGANVKAVQRMLGHAKASMTLDVYADLFDDDLDSVAANLDAAIITARRTADIS
jgi:integrase